MESQPSLTCKNAHIAAEKTTMHRRTAGSAAPPWHRSKRMFSVLRTQTFRARDAPTVGSWCSEELFALALELS